MKGLKNLRKKWKNVVNMKPSLFIALIVAAIAALVVFNLYPKEQEVNELDGFAKCLAEKEVVMYGADWCSHCQNEKKRFGTAFEFVPYVECPDEPKKCLAVGISGYPTWIFPDGKKLEGEQGLQKLSEESGCQLP